MVTTERVKRTADLQRFPGNREATVRRVRTQQPLDPTSLRRLVTLTLIPVRRQGSLNAGGRCLSLQERYHGAKFEIFETLGHVPMEEDAGGTAAVAFLRTIPAHPVADGSAGDRYDAALLIRATYSWARWCRDRNAGRRPQCSPRAG